MDYEKNAIEILRMIGSNNGFTVADSGGKDSSVLTHIAMKAGCPFEVVHNHTTVDAPETVYFIREKFKRLRAAGIMELHRYVTNELMNEKHNVFMWTIDKYLPQTEEIMSLLGYKLHARLIWDKGNGPAPAYTVRFAHEYLLWFYKKGNIILPDKDKRGAFSTVLRENSKRHHSQKPECAYQMLETFFPQAKKLELFARAERDGWDQWGNEL